MTGWIKLHRQLLDSSLWKDCTVEQKVVFITLLLMANHDTTEWIWNGEKYRCEPGQFVTSLASIKEQCGSGITIQNVRTALVKFEKYEFLTSKSTNKNRLISIENWAFYQGLFEEDNKESHKQLTSSSQATNKQLTTNKNVRMKECKKKRIKKSTSFSDFERREYDFDEIEQTMLSN